MTGEPQADAGPKRKPKNWAAINGACKMAPLTDGSKAKECPHCKTSSRLRVCPFCRRRK